MWVKGQEVKAFGKAGHEFTINKDKCLVPWWSWQRVEEVTITGTVDGWMFPLRVETVKGSSGYLPKWLVIKHYMLFWSLK